MDRPIDAEAPLGTASSRRDFLRSSAIGLAVVGGASALAACNREGGEGGRQAMSLRVRPLLPRPMPTPRLIRTPPRTQGTTAVGQPRPTRPGQPLEPPSRSVPQPRRWTSTTRPESSSFSLTPRSLSPRARATSSSALASRMGSRFSTLSPATSSGKWTPPLCGRHGVQRPGAGPADPGAGG